MYLINGQRAKLIQYNRKNEDNPFDDQDKQEIYIKCCPYDVEQAVRFGIYTTPEAKGGYLVPRWVDVKEGDQLQFIGNYLNKRTDNDIHTILEVHDFWLYNRMEYLLLIVK